MLPRVRRVGLVGASGDPRFALDRDALKQLLGAGLQAIPAQNPAEAVSGMEPIVSGAGRRAFSA
jgi:hypothetical protein